MPLNAEPPTKSKMKAARSGGLFISEGSCRKSLICFRVSEIGFTLSQDQFIIVAIACKCLKSLRPNFHKLVFTCRTSAARKSIRVRKRKHVLAHSLSSEI